MQIIQMPELVEYSGGMRKYYDMDDSIVFIGDSLIEWGNWEKFFPAFNVKNYGVAGNKTYEVLNRLKSIKEYPEKIFLMIGINDLADNRDIEDIVHDYRSIIHYLRKEFQNTIIHTLSIHPIDEKELGYSHLNSKLVTKLNNKIESLSIESKLTFINMYPLFINKNGQLKTDLRNDGVHLSSNGYKLWKELINKHLL